MYLSEINMIVAVGSVDGVCTAAALMSHLAPTISLSTVGLEFCQAFTVDRIRPDRWLSDRQVALVDLAVNTRDPGMTIDFLRRLTSAGHELVAIIDEHDAFAWRSVCAEVGVDFNGLAIQPVSQNYGPIKSSGALLRSSLGETAFGHTLKLCEAADAADRGDFTHPIGEMVNKTIKSNMRDDIRRAHLARHYAHTAGPDLRILRWASEYDTIQANHRLIVSKAKDVGGGITEADAGDKRIDMTSLMHQLYSLGARIAAVKHAAHDRSIDRQVAKVSFGRAPGVRVDLLETLTTAAGIPAMGFASKATVPHKDYVNATMAIRDALDVVHQTQLYHERSSDKNA